MQFEWPAMLWTLAAVPLLVLTYVLMLRRRSRAAVRYAHLATVREALGKWGALRRHLPPAILLLGVAALLFALARPTAQVTLPNHHQTIVLAVDVSLSMRARDVEPDRITAAQSAVRQFITDMPQNVRVGLVGFAGTATVVQKPTADRKELQDAVDRLQLQYGTATGSAILVSLTTLLPDSGIDLESALWAGNGIRTTSHRGVPIDRAQTPKREGPPPVAPGSYKAGAIVLLTDGRRTTGPDPIDAARMAADRGVRVFTVGFGTTSGAPTGFPESWAAFIRLDDEALKSVSAATQGMYFHASTAEGLKDVYKHLSDRFVLERGYSEVSALFAAAGAALAIIAALLSFAWSGRLSA